MKTNNYYNFAKGYMSYYTANSNVYSAVDTAEFVNRAGNTYTGIYKDKLTNYYIYDTVVYGIFFKRMTTLLTAFQSYNYDGVVFGNGTTEPSVDDYWLSGDMITTMTYNVAEGYDVNEDGSVVKKCTYTITNSGSEPITISEVGYLAEYSPKDSASETSVLLDHTLLEEPITIPAGGVGQVTYAVTFNIA